MNKLGGGAEGRGEITPRYFGGEKRYLKADLDAWLKKQKQAKAEAKERKEQ